MDGDETALASIEEEHAVRVPSEHDPELVQSTPPNQTLHELRWLSWPELAEQLDRATEFHLCRRRQ